MPIQERSASEIHNQRVDKFEAWCREKEFDHGNLHQLVFDQYLAGIEPLAVFTQEEINDLDYLPVNIEISPTTKLWSLTGTPYSETVV